jgi:WD40 repeat protein
MPQAQSLTPLDPGPYNPQPGQTFHPCGTLGVPQSDSSAYSLDGTLFALGYTSGEVKIYRTSDLALVATYAKASTAIASLQFSPDGTLIASASSDDPAIEIWRVADGTTLSRAPSVALYDDLQFSADGQHLGITRTEFFAHPSYAAHNMVSLRTVADGSETCQINDAVLLNFSPDGSTAWIASNDNVIAYDVRTCSVANDVPAVPVGGGTPFGMSPDGQMVFKYYDVASGVAPSQIGLPLLVAGVRAADGQTVWTATPTGWWPSIVMRLSPRGDFVEIVSIGPWKSGDTTLLNAKDGTISAHLDLGPSESFDRVSPDGSIVVSRDSSNEAVFWRAAGGSTIGQLAKSALAVAVDSVAFTANSAQLAVASGGQVRFWDMQARAVTSVAAFPYSDSAHNGIALSPDGHWLVGWTGDRLAVLSLGAGDDRGINWSGIEPTGALFSPDGQSIYVFNDTNASPAMCFGTSATGRPSLTDPVSAGFQASAYHLTVSSGGLLAALGETVNGSAVTATVTITRFDGAPVQTIVLTPGEYNSVSLAFSPDGQYLAGGFDFTNAQKSVVQVWRVSDGTAVSSFATPPFHLQHLAFSPDGNLLATLQDVWNWHDGTLVESFMNTYQTNPVVSPDGRMIATTSSSTVTLWCRP